MALKDDWKETGKGLGRAFAGLGKNIVRSAKTGIDAAAGENDQPDGEAEKSNVFNDGSWRQTGKDMGQAFIGLGQSLVHTAQKGLDNLDKDNGGSDDSEGGQNA